MDAHSDFLAYIERLESLRKDKKLTPNVCVRQEGAIVSTAKGGAGDSSIAVTTQAPTSEATTTAPAEASSATATTATTSTSS